MDGHEDGLGGGAALAAVALAVLAEDDGGADLALGEVVVPVGLGAV